MKLFNLFVRLKKVSLWLSTILIVIGSDKRMLLIYLRVSSVAIKVEKGKNWYFLSLQCYLPQFFWLRTNEPSSIPWKKERYETRQILYAKHKHFFIFSKTASLLYDDILEPSFYLQTADSLNDPERFVQDKTLCICLSIFVYVCLSISVYLYHCLATSAPLLWYIFTCKVFIKIDNRKVVLESCYIKLTA